MAMRAACLKQGSAMLLAGSMVTGLACPVVAYAASAAQPATAAHALVAATVAPDEAIKRLAEGNARFVSGHTEHPRQSPGRRTELATSQSPFAIIMGCADSRTSPELLFDQGLGDLFVDRTAGNVIEDHAIGSLEYAVDHLHASLIVVLGHERCGAIAAARETIAAGKHAEGHIDSLVTAIRPAVDATAGQDAEATCRANVANVVLALRKSEPVLRRKVDAGELRVVGAYYDLDTGAVTFMDVK